MRASHTHQLQRVHEPDYIRRIESGLLGRKEQIPLGVPATPRLVRAQRHRGGGHAARVPRGAGRGGGRASRGRHAPRVPRHGEGYCVFNDVAVAIRDLQDKQPNIRIMVVDTDAHQATAPRRCWPTTRGVFTYSIHVGRELSHEKNHQHAGHRDRALCGGRDYLQQLFTSLANALDAFAPDLVDLDFRRGQPPQRPLRPDASLAKDIQRRDEVLLGAFIRNRIPVAVLYGGGYNRQPEFTAKLHRNTIATAKKFAAQFLGL